MLGWNGEKGPMNDVYVIDLSTMVKCVCVCVSSWACSCLCVCTCLLVCVVIPLCIYDVYSGYCPCMSMYISCMHRLYFQSALSSDAN